MNKMSINIKINDGKNKWTKAVPTTASTLERVKSPSFSESWGRKSTFPYYNFCMTWTWKSNFLGPKTRNHLDYRGLFLPWKKGLEVIPSFAELPTKLFYYKSICQVPLRWDIFFIKEPFQNPQIILGKESFHVGEWMAAFIPNSRPFLLLAVILSIVNLSQYLRRRNSGLYQKVKEIVW